MGGREEEHIRRLCIDEKSMSSGHSYLTVLGDPERGRVLEVCETRRGEEVLTLLHSALSKKQREAVESTTIDMCGPFMTAAADSLPKADIVHDRLHVSRHLSEAADHARRPETRRLSKRDVDALKGSKYLFLRNRENIKETSLDQFEVARRASKRTAAVWRFKEAFRSFIDCLRMKEGRSFLASW